MLEVSNFMGSLQLLVTFTLVLTSDSATRLNSRSRRQNFQRLALFRPVKDEIIVPHMARIPTVLRIRPLPGLLLSRRRLGEHLDAFPMTNQADFLLAHVDTVLMNQVGHLLVTPVGVSLRLINHMAQCQIRLPEC